MGHFLERGNSLTRPMASAIQTAHGIRDFPAMLRSVRNLERHSHLFKQSSIAKLYVAVCELGLEAGAFVETTEYALKIMNTSLTHRWEVASLFIRNAVAGAEREDQGQKTRMAGQLSSFLQKPKNTIKIQDLPRVSKIDWLMTIHGLFSRRFLREQLELSCAVFEPDCGKDELELNAMFASVYLLSSRRLANVARENADVAKVRTMARFLLDKVPHIIKDRTKWDEETFHTVMLDLGCFELWHLQTELAEIRQPEKEDPIHLYLLLIGEMLKGPVEAFVILGNLGETISKSSFNETIRSELSLLEVQITRDFYESLKVEMRDPAALFTPQDWYQKALLVPRNQHRALVERITKLRAQLLPKLTHRVTRAIYFAQPVECTSLMGIDNPHGYLVYSKGQRALELYIFDQQKGRSFKMLFPCYRGIEGKPYRLEVELLLEGMGAKQMKKAPLLWEYFSLAVLIGSDLVGENEKSRYQKELAQIEAEIKKIAYNLFLAGNARALKKLQASFAAEARYQELQLELRNSRQINRQIFEGFVTEVETKTYPLRPVDLLFPLIEQVEIIDPQQAGTFFRETIYFVPSGLAGSQNERGTLPVGVRFTTRAGEKIWAVMRNTGRVEIIGAAPQTNESLETYLTELVLKAMVMLFTEAGARKAPSLESGRGYVLDPDNAVWTPQNLGLKEAGDIYEEEFDGKAQGEGLLVSPWFYRVVINREDWTHLPGYERIRRDEYLYHPLKDQSPAGKRAALETRGAKNIFVQRKILGRVKTLPPVPQRDGKQLVLAPKQRGPLREVQQAIFADTEPLPVFCGIYVVTTFYDVEKKKTFYHACLYETMTTDNGALTPEQDTRLVALIDEVSAKIEAGEFRDYEALLRGTARKKREKILAGLKSLKLAVICQEVEYFDLQTTFERPEMTPLAQMLAKGYEL